MDFAQILDMILHVDKTLGLVIAQYGTLVYFMLFAIIFSECGLIICPFLPGDSLLFIAGTFAANGAMSLPLLLVLLIVASVAGNSFNYWLGSVIGHKILARDYRWLDKNALNKTHEFYERHGGKTVVIARFLPLVRTFAPFVAGVSDMTVKIFQIFNVLGALLWVGGIVLAGYFFGNIPLVRDHLNLIVLAGVAAVVLPVTLGFAWKMLGGFLKK